MPLVVFWLWELGIRKKLGNIVFWTEHHPNFEEEGSFWFSWLHASVKVQQKSGELGSLEPMALYRNCMEYLLIFLGHFAGIEFVTEFVIQMNRHLRITPVQHLQDKMWVSSQAKVKIKQECQCWCYKIYSSATASCCSCSQQHKVTIHSWNSKEIGVYLFYLLKISIY